MAAPTFYRTASIGLLILNLALLAFILVGTGGHRPPPGGAAGVNQPFVEVLDAAQQAAFEELARTHHEALVALAEAQRALVRTHFDGLAEDEAFVAAPPAATDLQAQKIDLTYRHFLALKALLRPDQMVAFETFRQSALDRILHGAKKKSARPAGLDRMDNAVPSLDCTAAHTGPQSYHYHLEPKAFSDDDDALISIISDGFFVYGRKYNSMDNYSTDLDASGGHSATTQHNDEAHYHYHIQHEFYLNGYYIIFPGDYRGTPNLIQDQCIYAAALRLPNRQ